MRVSGVLASQDSAGVVHVTCTRPSRPYARTLVGASGACEARGVAAMGADGGPAPAGFTARTRNWYSVSLVRLMARVWYHSGASVGGWASVQVEPQSSHVCPVFLRCWYSKRVMEASKRFHRSTT